jgi:hypothetical protein
MAGRVLVVSTVPIEDEDLLRRLVGDPDEIKVVAPAAKISRLDWLTNDEQEARDVAEDAAERTADAAPGAADAELGDPDPVQAIEDALREWPADEVVVVVSEGEDATWLEEKAADRLALPVRRVDLD